MHAAVAAIVEIVQSHIYEHEMVSFSDSDEEEQLDQPPLRQPPPGLRNEDLPALFWCD